MPSWYTLWERFATLSWKSEKSASFDEFLQRAAGTGCGLRQLLLMAATTAVDGCGYYTQIAPLGGWQRATREWLGCGLDCCYRGLLGLMRTVHGHEKAPRSDWNEGLFVVGVIRSRVRSRTLLPLLHLVGRTLVRTLHIWRWWLVSCWFLSLRRGDQSKPHDTRGRLVDDIRRSCLRTRHHHRAMPCQDGTAPM